MASVIEIEEKYFLNQLDENKFNEIILKEKFKELKTIIEEDEYFTDIDSKYIENRTCLRIRRTNDSEMELTFKGKSSRLNSFYAKKESNINLKIEEYNEIIELLTALGYYSYIKVKKNRKRYTKIENDITYNVLVDRIENVGDFIEFEILMDTDNITELNEVELQEKIQKEFKKYIFKFESLKLEPALYPYRDFTAEKIFKKASNFKDKKVLFLDLDGTLINSEKYFFESIKSALNKYDYNLKKEEYIKLELEQNDKLFDMLKDKKVVPKELSKVEFMQDVYNIYSEKFLSVLQDKATLINFELLRQLKEKGIIIYLISTSKRTFINRLIEKLNLNNLFDYIVSREDVKNLKPNAEAYLKGIEQLKKDKRFKEEKNILDKILVVEDSKRGFDSAKSANLDVIGVSGYHLNKNQKLEANVFYFKNFYEFALIMYNNIIV